MKTILCYGDSNTYGYDPENRGRYGSDERWPGVLRELLGPGCEVIEEGCNGRTTVYTDPYEPWLNGLDYLRPCLKTHKPVDLMILMLGTNDLKSYFEASAEDIAAGCGTLIRAAQEFCMQVQGSEPEIILVSPPPVGEDIRKCPFYPDFDETSVKRSKEFAKKYELISKDRNCLFFDAAPVAQVSDLDLIHLSRQGHRSLGKALYEFITFNCFKIHE